MDKFVRKIRIMDDSTRLPSRPWAQELASLLAETLGILRINQQVHACQIPISTLPHHLGSVIKMVHLIGDVLRQHLRARILVLTRVESIMCRVPNPNLCHRQLVRRLGQEVPVAIKVVGNRHLALHLKLREMRLPVQGANVDKLQL
jgi:hypothetical protein